MSSAGMSSSMPELELTGMSSVLSAFFLKRGILNADVVGERVDRVPQDG